MSTAKFTMRAVFSILNQKKLFPQSVLPQKL